VGRSGGREMLARILTPSRPEFGRVLVRLAAAMPSMARLC